MLNKRIPMRDPLRRHDRGGINHPIQEDMADHHVEQAAGKAQRKSLKVAAKQDVELAKVCAKAAVKLAKLHGGV